jgi:hypothetical protein
MVCPTRGHVPQDHVRLHGQGHRLDAVPRLEQPPLAASDERTGVLDVGQHPLRGPPGDVLTDRGDRLTSRHWAKTHVQHILSAAGANIIRLSECYPPGTVPGRSKRPVTPYQRLRSGQMLG